MAHLNVRNSSCLLATKVNTKGCQKIHLGKIYQDPFLKERRKRQC